MVVDDEAVLPHASGAGVEKERSGKRASEALHHSGDDVLRLVVACAEACRGGELTEHRLLVRGGDAGLLASPGEVVVLDFDRVAELTGGQRGR
jgi:hypothetical protein